MEVLLKGSTKLNASPRKFAIPPLEFEDDNPKEISLDHLASIDVFERVTAMVKVLTSTEAIDVTGGKKKQDVLVADHSGTCKVVLWENNIGILKQDECYKLQNFVVRKYAAIKFLSMGKESSTIIPIADIGEVQHYPHVPDNIETITNASIVGVLRLDNYKSCLCCKARVEPCSPPLGRCSKTDCGMLQRFDVCAQQLSLCMSGESTHSLHAYGQMVQQLACVEKDYTVTEEALLKAPKLCSHVQFSQYYNYL